MEVTLNTKILVAVAGVLFGSGAAFAQNAAQVEACKATYQSMRDNQNNAQIALPLGRQFLADNCGTVYPTLVDPVKAYVAWAEQQQGGATATAPAPTAAPAPARPAAQGQAGGANTPKYKVGDHVEFSANGACLGDRYAIPTKGTIVEVNLGYTMNYVMQVDPEPNKSPKTISRPIYTQECGFRLLGGAAPAAPNYNCPLDAPAGPNSKSDGPSERVFKRAIYDEAVEAEVTHADVKKIGMSFEIFEMGQSYANLMTQGGLRQDASVKVLMHDGAPPNATIYPVKVRYSKCLQRPTWKRLWVIEENRDCFKNRFGDWVCPVGTGATKFLTQLDLPN